jgi:CBS domain-containing protein
MVVGVQESKSLKASDLMVDFPQVTPQTSVEDALGIMLTKRSQRILIISDGRLEGIATTYDFLSKIPWGLKPLDAIEVRDIMTRDVVFITPEDDLRHVVDLLFFRNIRFAPVVAEGSVKGIISRRELGMIFAENFGHKYKASDLMSYRYTTSTMHDSLNDFFEKMRVYDDKYIIILSGEDVVGIVTPTDVLDYLHDLEDVNLMKPYHIRDIMSKNPVTAIKSDRCDKIANTMIERNISGVPIIDQKLEGVIRYSSFLQFLEV